MKTVYDLSRDQLVELKQTYLCQLMETGEECLSWGELAAADDIIPDAVIYDHYAGVTFTDDDFC